MKFFVTITLTLLLLGCNNHKLEESAELLHRKATYIISEPNNRYNNDSLNHALFLTEKAIKLDSTISYIYATQGEIYMLKHEDSLALNKFRKAWSLDNRRYVTAIAVGAMYQSKGDYLSSTRYYNEALESILQERQSSDNKDFDTISNIVNGKAVEYILNDTVNYDDVNYILEAMSDSDSSTIKMIIDKITADFTSNEFAELIIESMYD